MKVTATNSNLVIEDYTSEDVARLTKLLSYKDKAKQYQLRRMAANPFSRNSPLYKKISREVDGCLLVEKDEKLIIPSGFFNYVKNGNLTDKRCDTGTTIALPWANKPHNMRPYQEEAVALMETNYRGLINFATGLGKTLTAIYAIRKFKKKALILCPGTSIADNFYNELRKAFGDSKVGYFGDVLQKHSSFALKTPMMQQTKVEPIQINQHQESFFQKVLRKLRSFKTLY